MYFVGVDLARGQEKPSGLAVLDGDGRLVHLSAQGEEGAAEAVLAPYVADDCLVAIDAPLVVDGAGGTRPCEAALNRDFARFDAGIHPADLVGPEPAGATPGAKLAGLLGLDTDPSSGSRRRAVEVYPHPAIVALFELGRTLKYRHRTGRSLSLMRAEMLRLTGLLEGLRDSPVPLHADEHPEWRTLVAEVQSATRRSDLLRAEAQIDAVVCAYAALFADRRPDLTTTYGDHRSGCIVTPTLHTGRQPPPRTPASVEETPGPGPAEKDPVRRAVQRYAELQPVLREVTDRFVALVTSLLDDAGINYLSVSGRAKSVASFAAKADRSVAGKPLYADPLEEITDQIGVRVITYLHSDVAAVADLLSDQMTVLDDRDMGQETASEGRFGYASRHLLLAVDAGRSTPPAYEALGDRRAQVQVRTVLQHAWAEFEHAIRYKGTIPEEHVPDLNRRFTLAAGLLELADREFSLIRDRVQVTGTDQRPEPDVHDPRISPQDLATFLTSQYADAGWSRTDHYAWVSGLLLELGVTSLDELAGLLTSVDSSVINARLAYRYPPGAVRRLDDALLAIFGTRYLELHGNSHREALLRARLEKLRAAGER